MIFRIYKKVFPRRLREWLSPFVSSLYLPVHFYSRAGDAGDSTVVACLGVNEDRTRLWGKRILGPAFVHTQGPRVWLWSLDNLLRDRMPDCNVVVVETHPVSALLLRWRGGFKVPMWIQFCVNTSLPLEDLKKRSAKLREQIPRLIRKHDLSCEINNDEEVLKVFVDTMYLPYISGRHGDTAFLSSMEEIVRVSERADLLLIRKGGEIIAGGLIEREGAMATLRHIGVKDNNPEYMKVGAVGALYYFSILHAKSCGLSEFNMGGTNPFLSDGVAFFKLTLKPAVARISYLSEYPVKLMFRKKSPYLLEFLQGNPFLHLSGGGRFEEMLLVDNTTGGYEQNLEQLLKKTRCDGVAGTQLAAKDDSSAARERLQKVIDTVAAPDAFSIVSWNSVFPGIDRV